MDIDPRLVRPAEPSRLATVLRAIRVAVTTCLLLAVAGAEYGVRRPFTGRDRASRRFYRRLVRHIQRLGATYVKFGQIFGTRRDSLPAALCDELSALHDRVEPMSPALTVSALRNAYGPDYAELFAGLDLVPVGSGSIACVYRARLRDGREVALKVQRPAIGGRMARDLSMLRRMMTFAERLKPFRGVPIGELTGFVCATVLRQLDFDGEAESLRRLRRNLAALNHVWIPATVDELCRPLCVAMEFIPGLVVRPVTDFEPRQRRTLAAQTLTAAYQMLFIDGFVHCDMHPGNLYLLDPGTVVVLDAGFSVQLPEQVRRLFADFFFNLAAGNGARCGEVVVESAAHISDGADLDGFVRAVADLVARNSGVPAREFELMTFGTALFDLQRDYGLYATSEFVFPLMSLLVIEGTVRALDPDIDFQRVGRPVLIRALIGPSKAVDTTAA